MALPSSDKLHIPILTFINDNKGKVNLRKIYEEMDTQFSNVLTKDDLKKLDRSGDNIWEKRIRGSLDTLRKREFVFTDQNGNWSITSLGTLKIGELYKGTDIYERRINIGRTENIKWYVENFSPPRNFDIVFVSADNSGTPGELNSLVLKSLGYDPNIMQNFNFTNGYYIFNSRKVQKIIFIVTVGMGNTNHLLKDNLQKAIRALEHEAFELQNKKIWIPLMGTGAGGLDFETSIKITVESFMAYSPKSWTELHISLPNELSDTDFEFLSDYAEKILYAPPTESSPPKKESSKDKSKQEGNDNVPTHLDNPSIDDWLNHKIFAKALSNHIIKIWDNTRWKTDSAFMMHIYGPWGSGKSNMLYFLGKQLQGENESSKQKWIIINFNAWQNQHIEKPWWSLVIAIYKQASSQLWENKNILKGAYIKFISLLKKYSRFKKNIIIGFFIIFIISIISIFLNSLGFDKLKEVIGDIGLVISLVTSILGILFTFSLGNDTSADSFLKTYYDPMERLKKDFKKHIKKIGYPIAIFIDDIDRCREEYVVSLLEGIQTLFRDSKVLYVIAGDRKWISNCFEYSYKNFSCIIDQPGQKLGYLFTEKLFQLSTRVPRVTNEKKAEYLKYLLNIKSNPNENDFAPTEETKSLFRNADNEEKVLEIIEENKNNISDIQLRSAAIERLSDREVAKNTEHILQDYEHLLEPNPRAMKRFINFYSVFRELTILEDAQIELAQLARWLILSMRWPVLADFLKENPEKIENFVNCFKKNKAKKINLGIDNQYKELQELITESIELKETIISEDGKIVLTEDEIKKCIEYI